ncbi:Protein MAL2 [Liparis tanakae]|uniref:Protein MAL2 n=1 Tax=Liparis tanakae TaxID=230148 RepID=A0A4Z2IPZ7_9TELE|nr:Protein MAL2 [Liparis tanakae]
MLCVFGALVWILVADSKVPVPLLQGWVIFVSLLTFILSSAYLIIFDIVYHFMALLFYFSAFVLEAATVAASVGAVKLPNSTASVLCISYPPQGNIFTVLDGTQYNINVAATIFAFVVTVCYGCSMMMGFRRWRMSP